MTQAETERAVLVATKAELVSMRARVAELEKELVVAAVRVAALEGLPRREIVQILEERGLLEVAP